MEVLKNVLIKEIDGGKMGDKVIIVDNLPKSLLYTKAAKRVVDTSNPNQPLIPEFKMVDGVRVNTGTLVDELLPGIEFSQTGDGAYCFFTQYNEAQQRLKSIDNYIKANVPVAERVPQREYYATQPGVLSSGTRSLNSLPRVVLPEPVSPPSKDVQDSGTPSAVSDEPKMKMPKVRKPLTEEQKQAARERLVKAREAKKAAAQSK